MTWLFPHSGLKEVVLPCKIAQSVSLALIVIAGAFGCNNVTSAASTAKTRAPILDPTNSKLFLQP